MKNHFNSLFNAANFNKTLILLAIAVLFIVVSVIIGPGDNIPVIAVLFTGIVLFYFSMLHPWKKVSYFVILAAVCLLILTLDFIIPFFNEAIAMSAGMVCFAGVVAGVVGIFTREKSWKRLPYAGAVLSLVALGMFITSVPLLQKGFIASGSEWMLISLQGLITVLLLIIGLVGKREEPSTKTLLIVAAIVLIMISAWGFYNSTLEFGDEVHSIIAARLFTRIYASVNLIIASLSLYACFNKK